jgi:hypothetical protein
VETKANYVSDRSLRAGGDLARCWARSCGSRACSWISSSPITTSGFPPSRGSAMRPTSASAACPWARSSMSGFPKTTRRHDHGPGRGRREDAGARRQRGDDRIPRRDGRVLREHRRRHAEAPLLIEVSGAGIPEITSGRSTLQALTEDAPELVSETLLVVREIGDLFRGENADRIERTLINAEAASEEFAARWKGFPGLPNGRPVHRSDQPLQHHARHADGRAERRPRHRERHAHLDREAGRPKPRSSSNAAKARSTPSTRSWAPPRYIAEDLTATTNELQAAAAELRRNCRARCGCRGADRDIRGNRLHRDRPPARGGTDAGPGQHASGDAGYDRDRRRRGGGARRHADRGGRVRRFWRRCGWWSPTPRRPSRVVTEAAETDLPVMIADIRTAVIRATTVIDTVGTDLTTASGRCRRCRGRGGRRRWAGDGDLRERQHTLGRDQRRAGNRGAHARRRRKRADRGGRADQRRDHDAGRGPQRPASTG